MDGTEIVAFGSLIGTIIGLIIGVVTIALSARSERRKREALTEMVMIQKRELELLERSMPEQLRLQQSYINLQREKQELENKREWAKMIGGALQYMIENGD